MCDFKELNPISFTFNIDFQAIIFIFEVPLMQKHFNNFSLHFLPTVS